MPDRGPQPEASSNPSAPLSVMVFSVDYKPQPGGIAEHAHKVALHLHRLGARVCVLAPRHGEYKEFDRSQPFPTYRVLAWPGLDWIFYFFYALRLIVRLRIGVVYCATSHPCGLICRLLALLVTFRYTITIHAHEVVYSGGGLRPAVKRLVKPLQVRMIGAADRVFAVSGFTKNALVESGVGEHRIEIIYNGVDLDELESAPKEPRIVEKLAVEGRPIILTVARLDIHKGHDTVIRALPAVLEEVPATVYVIVGEGPMRPALMELARASGVSDHVVFAGYTRRPETLALYQACSLFVMVSRIERGSAEGFGIAFLEAGAFSRPVVGGRSGGIPDAVEDGVSGLLVDPEDTSQVAGAICRILTDPGLASQLGTAGYNRVRSRFTWDDIVRKVLESLEGL
jgi:phosphatidylinositol alpha-1,6-mannosyltransferase